MSALETNDAKEKYADLSKNKRATVRQFKNLVLIDIREYYHDASGTAKPGKKGISLTKDQWNELLAHKDAIQEAIDALEDGQSSTKKAKHETASKEASTEPSSVKEEPAATTVDVTVKEEIK